MTKAQQLYNKYKTILDKAGINTKNRLAFFFGHLQHESKLTPINENLNYSYDRLLEIFKSDFDTNKDRVLSPTEKKVAEMLAKKPKEIANFVYANQNGNGGVNSGDGYKYRGRGFIQITGRSNYDSLSKDTGIDYLNNPDKLLNEADSIIASVWFWKKNRLNTYADKDDVKGSTIVINGGYNGLKERKKLIEIYKNIF